MVEIFHVKTLFEGKIKDRILETYLLNLLHAYYQLQQRCLHEVKRWSCHPFESYQKSPPNRWLNVDLNKCFPTFLIRQTLNSDWLFAMKHCYWLKLENNMQQQRKIIVIHKPRFIAKQLNFDMQIMNVHSHELRHGFIRIYYQVFVYNRQSRITRIT